jgi:hypothetical protein
MILLLISAQADDLWIGPAWPSPAQTDDDEYLPPDQHEYREQSQTRQVLEIVGQTPNSANTFPSQSDSQCGSKLAAYLDSRSLYVFMSLQR